MKNNFEDPRKEKIEEDEAAAYAEKPFYDAAVEEGATPEEKSVLEKFADKRAERAAESFRDKKEKSDTIDQAIVKAKNFEELYRAVEDAGEITGRSGKKYSSRQLIEFMETAREEAPVVFFVPGVTEMDSLKKTMREFSSPAYITGAHGLREKVSALLLKEFEEKLEERKSREAESCDPAIVGRNVEILKKEMKSLLRDERWNRDKKSKNSYFYSTVGGHAERESGEIFSLGAGEDNGKGSIGFTLRVASSTGPLEEPLKILELVYDPLANQRFGKNGLKNIEMAIEQYNSQE